MVLKKVTGVWPWKVAHKVTTSGSWIFEPGFGGHTTYNPSLHSSSTSWGSTWTGIKVLETELKEVEEMLKKEQEEGEVRLGLFSSNNILLSLSLFAASPPLGFKLDIFHLLKVVKDFFGKWDKNMSLLVKQRHNILFMRFAIFTCARYFTDVFTSFWGQISSLAFLRGWCFLFVISISFLTNIKSGWSLFFSFILFLVALSLLIAFFVAIKEQQIWKIWKISSFLGLASLAASQSWLPSLPSPPSSLLLFAK